MKDRFQREHPPILREGQRLEDGGIMSGRNPVKEGKKFFCRHKESEGQPKWEDLHFTDIVRVQCERCGWWHYPKGMPSQSGALLREMFRW